MNRSMINASNTMTQLQQQLDLISNNMANANTVGYKRRETNFSELLYQQFNNQPNKQAEIGRSTPFSIRQGSGARLAHTSVQMTPGALKQTNRPLDAALTQENLFFKVLVNENGQQVVRYTRDGSFHLAPTNNAGQWMLADSNGNAVAGPNDAPILVRGSVKEVRIDANGNFTAVPENTALPDQTFELGIVEVKKPHLLQGKGNNLFGLPNLNALNLTVQDVVEEVDGAGRAGLNIRQGALEESNVDMASEMTELMITQKSYQFNSKSISIADQMMGLVNGLRS
ncbi:MAG TPA: flagellar hook-basal body protein [Bacillus sp. (in: firmicutes)]|nr:flagellar hook-basal body protein [Bacillus sp. (in: firmicutes)]